MSAEGAYELFKKGSELLEAGDFMAASISLERARDLEPDKSSIREALGRAYFRSSRFEQAAEEFAAVVERHPVDDYAHFCLGRSLANTGRTAEARRHAALGPDKSSIREALGRAYFRSSRFEEAAEEFAAVVERYPVNDYAHFCLGRSLANTGRTAEARRHAALAANMRPDRKDYQAFSRRLRPA